MSENPAAADSGDHGPGAGPPPRPLTDDELVRLLVAHQFGVLAANRRDGHPHLSTVAYTWDASERVARVATTADRLKVRMLRRDPRSALHVSGGNAFSFAVAEGEAELSPVSAAPGDAAGQELLGMQPPFDRAEDEAAFLQQMVTDRRLVIRLRASRLYGIALDIPS